MDFIFPGSANFRTGCWYIEIFRDTTEFDFGEDLSFRFSEWIIPEMMPFYPGYFRENCRFTWQMNSRVDDVFAAEKVLL